MCLVKGLRLCVTGTHRMDAPASLAGLASDNIRGKLPPDHITRRRNSMFRHARCENHFDSAYRLVVRRSAQLPTCSRPYERILALSLALAIEALLLDVPRGEGVHSCGIPRVRIDIHRVGMI